MTHPPPPEGSSITPPRMNIAVVGSGISGLSAAWLLAKNHDVTIYEQNGRFGGHANTLNVDQPSSGRVLPVDAGFIVYNELTYPNLTAFFNHLGVETLASDMSFGVSLRKGSLEYSSRGLTGIFGQRLNTLRPSYWKLLGEIRKFYEECSGMDADLLPTDMTVGQAAARGGYSKSFLNDHLVPMAAAIWSASADDILAFPFHSFLRFFLNHRLLNFRDRPQWRTVAGGSKMYIEKVLADSDLKWRVSSAITKIIRHEHGVTLVDSAGQHNDHDQVVIATHSDQALGLLDKPDFYERSVLGDICYRPNQAVMHTDPALMPKRKAAWASWNFLTDTDGYDNQSPPTVSYWMNLLQKFDSDEPVFVTLNPTREPDPDKVLHRVDYEHPVFNQAALKAQRELHTLQGRHNTWFCGAYFGYGFHEDGLQAGLAVAEMLGGAPRPWSVDGANGRIYWPGVDALFKPPQNTEEFLEAAE